MQASEKLTYSIRETAQVLGLSRNSVYQGCLKGEIPSVRIGKRILVPKGALLRILEMTKNDDSPP
jgi:excisionase family DNA binding protein